MKSILLIGRGPSVLRCKKEWVEKFDEIAICNNIVVDGFEENLGTHFDTWFRNLNCGFWLCEDGVKQLGLTKVVHITGFSSQEEKDELMKKYENLPIEQECVGHEMSKWFLKKYSKLDPSTGIRAFEYCVQNNYDVIGTVGIDLHQRGEPIYFNRLSKKQGWPKGHDTGKSTDYMNKRIGENPDIKFRIISNAAVEKQDNVEFDLEF